MQKNEPNWCIIFLNLFVCAVFFLLFSVFFIFMMILQRIKKVGMLNALSRVRIEKHTFKTQFKSWEI